MRAAFYIGVVLLVISAWPLAMMVAEVLAEQYARQRYQMVFSDAVSTAFGGHTVEIDRAHVPPRITIDGKDYTSTTATEKCMLTMITDRWARRQFLTITETEPRTSYRDLHYRILRIPEREAVQEEVFHMDKRIPIYRGMLIRQIHPSPMGYYSDVLSGWPSRFFPVLYPWASGATGVLLTFTGGLVLRRRKRLTMKGVAKSERSGDFGCTHG
jgi:hypothetical protein